MSSLKKQALSGMKWTSFSTGIRSVLQIIQLIILARFLNAEDFGLVAIVMVVIGFSQLFMDMGISNAIIHKQHITDMQLSSLYWLNIFFWSGFDSNCIFDCSCGSNVLQFRSNYSIITVIIFFFFN